MAKRQPIRLSGTLVKKSFTYFDSAKPHRIDAHADITAFLKRIEGKVFADHYDFCNPRVQFGSDMALLTYQLYADSTLLDMKYNCIELYQKEENGEWHVIHSAWSLICPMDMDFSKAKEIV